jgi:PKD repeat protein
LKSWIKLCLVALAMLGVAGVSAQTIPYRQKPAFPQITLPEQARGERAIQLLGSRLPEVAAWYGKTPGEFASILRRDRTAIVDRKGRMLYVEESEPPTGSVGSPTSTGALVSLDQTLKLHSKPGSKRTIYLNFVGATLTNTVWNDSTQPTITALPFDLDGVPYSFSTTELERIQYIWQRVAEDYAAFDVDVTTEPPASGAITRSSTSDDVYGTMVLITQRTFYSCSCGGVAYIGAFDDTTDFYKPALVFYDRLGAGNEKYVAEAISHEAGHNMGLHHDGTSTTAYYQGANGWAPIMGTGYYQNTVQWSKGEYADANNKEDDFAVMQSNGLPLRADDHGNTAGTATQLASSTASGVSTLSGAGIIHSAADVDVFAFSAGAGTLTLQVNPSARSPDLDVGIELRDSAGNLLASAAPTDSMAASVAINASAGTYYLFVRGTGRGDWSTGYGPYGSVGEYSIAGTVPASASQAPVAALSATPTSGPVPLVVNFDASSSIDPDGTIVSYMWNFGDGTTASGATASKTYSTAGTYSASVKVTDNAGLTTVKSVTITATTTTTPPVTSSTSTMSVAGLTVTATANKGGQTQAMAQVTINDNNGKPVAGATVNGTWSGAVSGSASGTTSTTGMASMTSSRTKSSGSITFTVTGVSLSGYTYVPANNAVTSATK